MIRFYETDRFELFNLESDPYEKNNIAESETELAASLLKKLEHWQSDVNAQLPVSKNRISETTGF